ncbi:U1 small nuclear ribonucleoprotein of 70kDa MW N terminal-domain-containing protein [Syncephalis plumigaleata]|nr:U1 small nuclear ribonucleoprotein of 70kDa MW N terminal-domain-containing protein [Syncephalis plumigaleata]
MTEKLPPHLLRLFVPRPALKHETPLDRDLRRRRGPTIDGIGSYFNLLGNDDPDYKPQETPEQARLRRRAEKLANNEKKIKAQAEHWDPHKDAKASGDPYKTLFIGRLSYEATEEDIRRAFDRYGKIVNVALVREQDTQKSRGYAFIEFEDERDMKGI